MFSQLVLWLVSALGRLVPPECACEGPVQRLALGLLFRCQVACFLVILGLQLPWFLEKQSHVTLTMKHMKPNAIQIPSLLALVGLWRRHFLFPDSLLAGLNSIILLQRTTYCHQYVDAWSLTLPATIWRVVHMMISYTVRMSSARTVAHQPTHAHTATESLRGPLSNKSPYSTSCWRSGPQALALSLADAYRILQLLRTPELAKAFICIVLCVASMQFSKVASWEMFFWEYGPCVKISANLFVAIFYFARCDFRFTEDRWIFLHLLEWFMWHTVFLLLYLAFTAVPLKNHGNASWATKRRMQTLWSCDQLSGWLRRIGTCSEKWQYAWVCVWWMWCTYCEELEPCMKVNLIRDNPLAAMKMADDEFKDCRQMLGCLRFQCVSICFR